MLNDRILQQIFDNNQPKVEERISKKYHKKVKEIKEKKLLERENIKQSIIAEIYYKEGYKDGLKSAKRNIGKTENNC